MNLRIILLWKNKMTKIKKVDLGAEDQLKLEKDMKELKKGKDTEKLK